MLAPKDLNILYYRGRAHALTAQKAYQELSRLDPDSWLVHRALGESYSESAQPEKAIAEFQIAIQKQPNDADLYESLGSEEQKISHFDEATKAFQQQLKLNPHSPVALYNLGRIQVEHGHPAEGVALLQQAIANHTTPAPAEFYLGLGLTDLQRYDEAASWLEKVLDHQPSSFIRQSDYYQLARVYQKLGRKQDSDRALAELKRLKSESSPGNQPSQ